VTILCYHAVDPDWVSPLSIHPSQFARQVAWLARRRKVVPLQQAVGRLRPSGRLPAGLATLTFDDGFESLYRHALPVLQKHALPATVFLVAETLTPAGRTVDWVDDPPADPLRTLTLEQVLEMKAAGITFGSHSFSHRDLTALSDDECERDLRMSRELLEDLLHERVRLLAYPRGNQDERVRSAAQRAGFTHGFAEDTTGPESRGTYALGRAGVYPANGQVVFRAKASRWYLPFRTSRAFPAIRGIVRGPSKPPRPRG
jgi:peptidoglycan/xylan/chitin deacetylase (PgdA/CDA1 family)